MAKALRNAADPQCFGLNLKEPHQVLARISGKMRKHFIRILFGD
jgi:translation initiation factor IF-1